MCCFTLVYRSATELGFDTSKLPAKYQGVLDQRIGRPLRPLRSKFYDMPEEEQRRIFANDSLFRLWKEEKLPLGSIIKYRGEQGWFVPKTFAQVQAELPKLGGISYPRAEIRKFTGKFTGKELQSFLATVDPADRANKTLALLPNTTNRKNLEAANIKRDGLNPFSNGSAFLASAPVDDIRPGQYNEIVSAAQTRKGGMHWLEFNEAARVLKLYERRGTDGSLYWAIPKRQLESILSKLK